MQNIKPVAGIVQVNTNQPINTNQPANTCLTTVQPVISSRADSTCLIITRPDNRHLTERTRLRLAKPTTKPANSNQAVSLVPGLGIQLDMSLITTADRRVLVHSVPVHRDMVLEVTNFLVLRIHHADHSQVRQVLHT